MTDIAPTTGSETPVGTEAPAPATPPTSTPPATEGNAIPEGFELIRTEDKTNLISARDRANNEALANADFVNTLAKERDIDTFLDSNKEKYPDLVRDDLMHASSVDELETIAARTQKRYEDVVQEKLLKTQVADTPILSPAEKAAQIQKLKDNPGSASFQKALEVKQSA